jgi:hypothetical protein
MVPILILYTLRRLKIISISDQSILKLKSIVHKTLVLVLLLVLTSTHAFNNPTKETPMVFEILKNEKVIGTINMYKKVSGDSITYHSESQIKTRLLLSFNITGNEKSVFKNGVLIFSSVYRTLNNKVKANHSISQQEHFYNIYEDNRVEELRLENIQQNLITLYFKEPIGISTIFCDNQKEMIQIQSLGQGKYKVQISNGKYNIFHYKNGRCIKVEAVSPMFDVILIPIQS